MTSRTAPALGATGPAPALPTAALLAVFSFGALFLPQPVKGAESGGPLAQPELPASARALACCSLDQETLDDSPPGTVLVLEPGTWFLDRQLTIPAGVEVVGRDDYVEITGSRVTVFQKVGNLWAAAGQTQETTNHYPYCPEDGYCRPEQVWLDSVALEQVEHQRDLSAGHFWFDYKGDTIYLADDPSDHEVHVSWTRKAFVLEEGATLRNVHITRFRTLAAMPAELHATVIAGARAELQDVTISDAPGACLRLEGPGSRALRTRLLRCGRLGLAIGREAHGAEFSHGEIGWGNHAGYNTGHEAACAKTVGTNGVTFDSNWVHDCDGPGLWTDIGVRGAVIRNNTIARTEFGVFHEISYDARIEGNTLTDNRHGIKVVNGGEGKPVEIKGNQVTYFDPDGTGITVQWDCREDPRQWIGGRVVVERNHISGPGRVKGWWANGHQAGQRVDTDCEFLMQERPLADWYELVEWKDNTVDAVGEEAWVWWSAGSGQVKISGEEWRSAQRAMRER